METSVVAAAANCIEYSLKTCCPASGDYLIFGHSQPQNCQTYVWPNSFQEVVAGGVAALVADGIPVAHCHP